MSASQRVRVRRVSTDTPLAREHERALSLRTIARAPEIPWMAFERSAYPDPALGLAGNSLRALAVGEYGAIATFARIAGALAHNGAPLDLITAAARVPADEARHAEYALRAAALCA